MAKKNILLIASLFLTAVVSTGCGVSKAQYLKAQDEAQVLAKDKQALGGEVARLQEENKKLTEALNATKGDQTQLIVDLSRQKQTLEQEKADVAKQKEEEIAKLKETYDKLMTDLNSEVKMGEVTITQLQNKLSVNLVEKILFNSGEAEIKKEGLDVLKKVGDILKKVAGKEIRIEGHTDNIPIGAELKNKYPSNWHLSTARAINVAVYLQYGVGVVPESLSVAGYSSYRPITDNKTPEGRAQNRRIEIVLVPMDIERVVVPQTPVPTPFLAPGQKTQ
ncbi:MAG: flagellar motor protein MotB [bacterium]